jgi:hypothetical protein
MELPAPVGMRRFHRPTASNGSKTQVLKPDLARTSVDPAQEIEALRTTNVTDLTPDQAIDERNVGKRVRWAGGVHDIETTDRGVCLTILYARSSHSVAPRWTPEPTYQTFKACTAGSYDAELVHDFTNVTIVGKVSGKAYIGMGGGGSDGPVVEIERLFRWSDCLAGDTSSVCKYGFLTPKAGSDVPLRSKPA